MVLRTFSPARAWRPAVVARLARTLGSAKTARSAAASSARCRRRRPRPVPRSRARASLQNLFAFHQIHEHTVGVSSAHVLRPSRHHLWWPTVRFENHGRRQSLSGLTRLLASQGRCPGRLQHCESNARSHFKRHAAQKTERFAQVSFVAFCYWPPYLDRPPSGA